MNSTYPARLDNKSLITGLFREALFFSRTLITTSQSHSSEFVILDILEPSARQKHAERLLVLKKIESTSLNFSIDQEISFRCQFPKFIAHWSAKLHQLDSERFQCPVPISLELENQRSAHRLDAGRIEKLTTPVLVYSNGLHTEGLLEIEDTSARGLGATLIVSDLVPIEPSTHISGLAMRSSGHLKISGTIVHASLLGMRNQRLAAYRIGLVSTNDNGHSSRSSERRKFSRNAIVGTVLAQSPLNPKYRIELNLVDVSVAGLAAELKNPMDSYLLPLGCGIEITDFNLIAEVASFDANIYRFQITRGNLDARLKWLKKIVSSQKTDTAISSPINQTLIDLFCESGSVSSAFLNAQISNADKLITDLGTDSALSPWVHRWIDQTAAGETRGHISSIRIGDNAWYLADLAGSTDIDRKLSSDFVSKFLLSFREYALSATPCPKLVLSWNTGHPYWQGFETFLASSEHTLARVLARYTRFADKLIPKDNATSSLERILPEDYHQIDKLTAGAGTTGAAFLKALDFSVDTFGSPSLKTSITESASTFQREYFLVKHAELTWLAVVSSFPSGLSINRTPDVAWLFPLNNSAPVKAPPQVLETVRAGALELGISLPGVLEITGLDHQPGATKLMLWYLVHPRALDWFAK